MIVEFVEAAETELDAAVAYYSAQRVGLGDEFVREVAAAVARISEYPNAWQRLGPDIRRCRLRRFEFGLVYRVRGDVATIYAVMHLKRKPGYWRQRLGR